MCIRLNNAGKWACDRLTEDADFGKKKFIFSDEAHFDLGGYGNKQTCRIWGTKNPHAYIKMPIHPNRYRAILNEFLFTKIEEEDIGNIWFQQFDILRPVFEDRIINRRADVVWPPRSCDLIPLDYYLWDAK